MRVVWANYKGTRNNDFQVTKIFCCFYAMKSSSFRRNTYKTQFPNLLSAHCIYSRKTVFEVKTCRMESVRRKKCTWKYSYGQYPGFSIVFSKYGIRMVWTNMFEWSKFMDFLFGFHPIDFYDINKFYLGHWKKTLLKILIVIIY